MIWYDWLILILPVCFVMFMGFHVKRYIRGVSDFLSAGRLCGRYVISVGDVANFRDFNLFTMVIVVAYGTVMNRASWIGTASTNSAKSPHEQKMANLLGNWRGAIISVFYLRNVNLINRGKTLEAK